MPKKTKEQLPAEKEKDLQNNKPDDENQPRGKSLLFWNVISSSKEIKHNINICLAVCSHLSQTSQLL